MPDPLLLGNLRVNGTLFSWTSSRLLVAGAPTVGCVSISYEMKRTTKHVHAMRQDGTPVGWTAGKVEPGPFTMKWLKSSGAAIRTDLLSIGLGSWGDAEWPLLLQATEPTIGAGLPITLSAFPCKITKVSEERAEGMDELLESWEVWTLGIIENGFGIASVARSI